MEHLTWRNIRRILWFWGPPVLLMGLLFVTSSVPKPEPPDKSTWLYFYGAMPYFRGPLGVIELVIKKGAHLTLYGLLGLLFVRALVAWGMDLRRAGYLAIVLAVCYALTDEAHQATVPGRSPSGIDIGLDFVGAASFILLARRRHERRRAAARDDREPALLEQSPSP